MWKKAIAVRAVAAIALIASGYAVFEGRILSDLSLPLLTVISLSLITPGLGVAALTLLIPLSEGSSHPLVLLLTIPAVALAARFWPQTLAWVAATGPRGLVINQVALAALLFSLRFASPGAAAALMFFYALLEGFKLSLSTPAGAFDCRRLIVAQGLPDSVKGDFASLTGNWFFTNLIGSPRLLLLALTYAAAGAAAAKLHKLEGAWLTNLIPPFIMLLAFHIVTRSMGLKLDVDSVSALAMCVAMTLAFELRRVKPPFRKNASRQKIIRPSSAIPPHLEYAWRALCQTLTSGERLLIVFGPSGCGKTLVVREAVKACRLKITDSLATKGGVILVEKAESLQNISELIRRTLASGAKCVILETSRPLTLMKRIEGLPLRRAIYVMPPDEGARSQVISRALANHLDRSSVAELAKLTQRYTLRGLTKLLEGVKVRVKRGDELKQAVAEALQEIPPDLSLEELAECEKFMLTFRGLIVGFLPVHMYSIGFNNLNEDNATRIESASK